jgi:hypothetical protein
MKSVKELGRVIERHGRLRTADGLRIAVLVEDARRMYRRIEYGVSTLAGKACVSVTSGPVELENKA